MMTNKSLPLIMANAGERLRITAIPAGRGAEAHLGELGLHVGREIRIMQRQSKGPLLLGIGDARIAVGFGLCSKVLVSLVDQEQQEKVRP